MPATKEQRDFLFAKMKDAGYTFDFEKKELKKIENEIEIPFGAKDSELQEATYYIPKGFYAEIDGNKVVIKKGNQKPAWSEEDEKRVHRISDFIWKNRKGDTDEIYQQEQDVNWLKSLRLQNRWKPSDEQMTDKFYCEHNVDDDADVQISKRKEADEKWKAFINEHFDIPCTMTCSWFGLYDLKAHKWAERYAGFSNYVKED